MALSYRSVINVDRVTLRALPTPEIEEAVARLVDARTRLTDITKELNKAHANRYASIDGRLVIPSYRKNGRSSSRFETAADEFTAAIHRAKEQLGE